MKTQFAKASEANFQKGTWKFKMNGPFSVRAGGFAIVDESVYEDLLRSIRSMRLSMGAHPDCQEGSEFEDFIESADSVYERATGETIL